MHVHAPIRSRGTSSSMNLLMRGYPYHIRGTYGGGAGSVGLVPHDTELAVGSLSEMTTVVFHSVR